MIFNNGCDSLRLKNARIVLEVSCAVRKNETVVIIARRERIKVKSGPDIHDAYALASAALDLQANPVIIDITEYSETSSYTNNEGLEAISAALRAANVVIGSFRDFRNLGFGKFQSADVYHTGEQRWMSLMAYMDKWEITAEEVMAISERTRWLSRLLDSARRIRVTSTAGTDFTFTPMKYTPVLAIIPNYGEIAITPQHGTESGIVVVDGPTQMGVRPVTELDRQPLRIYVESGEVMNFTGDSVQVKRLEDFINSDFPPARSIDEVGIPTTRIKANDMCWSDGTHACNSIHIALGNNSLRGDLIHGPLHMDGEVLNSSISIDGKTILKDGVFID